jgi:hypothetical protein
MFRIQVEYGPKSKIVIFKPSESNLPDEQKTYFTQVEFGQLEDQKASELLQPEDLFIEGNTVGVDLSKYQQRTGLPEPPNYIINAFLFKRFLDDIKKSSEE